MKITRNEKDGKCIIDFEGLEIDISDIPDEFSNVAFIPNLFNYEFVSEVRNGVWLFNKPSSAPTGVPESP